MINILGLSIEALSKNGYVVYIPLHDFQPQRIVAVKMKASIRANQAYNLCALMKPHKPEIGSPTLRIPKHPDTYDYILGVDTDSEKVWMIPIEDVLNMSVIRLGERYNNYIILGKTDIFKQALEDKRTKADTVAVASKLREKINEVF